MSLTLLGEIIPSQDIRAGRMLAGGRLTVTVVSKKSGQHLTLVFATKLKNDGRGKRWLDATWAEALAYKGMVFIGTVGKDRIGTFFPDSGKFSPARGADSARVWAATHVLAALHRGEMETTGFTMSEEAVCGKCGRALTDPISIERGIGPDCFGQMTGSEHQLKQRPVLPVSAPVAPVNAPGIVHAERLAAIQQDGKGRNVPVSFADLASRVKP